MQYFTRPKEGAKEREAYSLVEAAIQAQTQAEYFGSAEVVAEEPNGGRRVVKEFHRSLPVEEIRTVGVLPRWDKIKR